MQQSVIPYLPTPELDARQIHCGVRVLGLVTSVTSKGLSLSLPFGVTGFIPVNELADGTEVPPTIYQVGDYVPAIVVAQDVRGSPILSLQPSRYRQRDIDRNSYVICQITSEEDHGWLATLGDAAGTVGFLSTSRVPSDLRARLKVGYVVGAIVVDIGSSSRIYQLSLLPQDISTTIPSRTYAQLLPGQLAKAEVALQGYGYWGVYLAAKKSRAQDSNTRLFGYIISGHLRRNYASVNDSSVPYEYGTHVGFEGRFRVVLVDTDPKVVEITFPLVYLSNLENVLDSAASDRRYAIGQVIPSEKLIVAQHDKRSMFAVSRNEERPVMLSIPRIKLPGEIMDLSVGSPIPAPVKVLGYHPFEDLYLGSADQSDINGTALGILEVGKILSKATKVLVTKVYDYGANLEITDANDSYRGFILQTHYGNTLKHEHLAREMNLNKGYGTMRIIGVSARGDLYYVSLADLGTEPIFLNRETVRVGQVSRGVVSSFPTSNNTYATIQFSTNYMAIYFNAQNVSLGQAYDFISVRNDDKFTVVDLLSPQQGDDPERLRSDPHAALFRVLQYSPRTRSDLPYASSIDGSGDLPFESFHLLTSENSIITISDIALGGFKLDVQLHGDHTGHKSNVFLHYRCISYDSGIQELVSLFLGELKNKNFFDILPAIRIITYITLRDSTRIYLAAATPHLVQDDLVLTQGSDQVSRGNIYHGIITYVASSHVFGVLSDDTSFVAPLPSSNEADVLMLALVELYATGTKETTKGDWKVEVRGTLTNIIRDGRKAALRKGPVHAEALPAYIPEVAPIDFVELELPNTPELNEYHTRVDDYKVGEKVSGMLLINNMEFGSLCQIYDLGCGVIGRLTFESAAGAVLKVGDRDAVDTLNRNIGGDVPAFFKQHVGDGSEPIDLVVVGIRTLYGEQELSTLGIECTNDAYCRLVDLTLPGNKLTPLLAAIHSVVDDRIIVRMVDTAQFVLVHAVDVFDTPKDICPLGTLYAPSQLIILSQLTSDNVPCPLIWKGLNFLAIPPTNLEASIFQKTDLTFGGIGAIKPIKKNKRALTCILRATAARLAYHFPVSFLTVTSPVEYDPKFSLFEYPTLALTRISDTPQDLLGGVVDGRSATLDALATYHMCTRISQTAISLRSIDEIVPSMAEHSFVAIKQPHLFLPQTGDDLTVERTYLGYIQPYRAVVGGLTVAISESICLFVPMREVSDTFITLTEVEALYAPRTLVKVRYLKTDEAKGQICYIGTIKPSVVENPKVRHPSTILQVGTCVVGCIDAIKDNVGVYLNVQDCYPPLRVRANVQDAINSTHTPGEKTIMKGAARCSRTYTVGQYVYCVILEITPKGVNVGLKTAHFLAAGIDVTKLPPLEQPNLQKDTSKLKNHKELLARLETLPTAEPGSKRTLKYDILGGEIDTDEEDIAKDSTTDQAGLPLGDGILKKPSQELFGTQFLKVPFATREEISSSSDGSSLSDSKDEEEVRRGERYEHDTASTSRAQVQASEQPDSLIPTTVPDFERALAGNERSSYLWIRYAAYHIDRAAISEARDVLTRACAAIPEGCPDDRQNIWLAFIAFEERFGGTEASILCLREAIRRNDPNNLLRSYCHGKIVQGDWKAAEQGYEILLEKRERKEEYLNWRAYLAFLYNIEHLDMPQEVARTNLERARTRELQRAMSCIAPSKQLRLTCDIARLEYRIGEIDRGRAIFNKLVGDSPKHIDIWGQYLDAEEKFVAATRPQDVRALYERVCSTRFPLKKMIYLFKRFLTFEQRHGTALTRERVRELAIQYADAQAE
ncbi:RRNA biogenesis protein RRP5 [Giardia muris]|uniref:rRNA biogenesis protein RRP5 n=1 Tax=Giardia muris TaxID=5742 RepID=A0A4Z1TAM1_GIAMU|nr:RRNA biogenesis protein RRP5 [Giardia muris]|eukprot:TNJ29569.1 RRNA biogenesis protein RRP5 [Giardia muris]